MVVSADPLIESRAGECCLWSAPGTAGTSTADRVSLDVRAVLAFLGDEGVADMARMPRRGVQPARASCQVTYAVVEQDAAPTVTAMVMPGEVL